jgi:hypothetical protein
MTELVLLRRAQRETERAPELSGRKFIKQAGSNSADSSPKAEPREQRRLPYVPLRAGYRNGGTACPIHSHLLHWLR